MLGLQRISNVLSTHWLRCMYSSSVTATKGSNKLTDVSVGAESADKKPKSRIVAAAFESLKNENDSTTVKVVNTFAATSASSKINNLDERIANAKTVNGLLSVSENSEPMSRKHALRIVSILAEWSSANRVKLSDFENDSRFVKVCKILGRTFPKNGNPVNGTNSNNNNKRVSGFRTDDLNTVLGVAGDDEAAKLIASISVPQMVKVMSTLAQRKRRSTPLLRSLAYNISSSTEQLDIKQCADVLFAMASLNFQDSVLAAKMCSDIQACLPTIKEKSAVVGSIITSLGILKYRDLDIMEALTQWILKNIEVCRPQDLSAYFITSAVLNFQTTSFEEVKSKLVKSLVKEDFAKKVDWLNHVWALGLLNLAEASHLESVLNEEFVNLLQVETSGLTPNAKMKLLNLNSISKLLVKNCSAQLKEGTQVFDLHIVHSKSKQLMFNGLLDALKSLLPSSNHVQSHVDTKMGFYIDALCAFDAKMNPLPLDKENPDAIKIALMLVDFHDICNGPHRSTSGIVKLSFDLLEKCGYKVVPVPFNEFSTSDKLLKRVQYLEGKIKSIVRVTN